MISPFIIDAACYLHSKACMPTGWNLVADTAKFERDFLLPAPSTNYHGTVRSELRHAIAYAMHNRVLSCLSIDGSRIFSFPVTQYWTPHSSRTFLPSATLLLDFPKHKRDFLGGWAQASDRYARTSCRSTTNRQRAVIRALHSQVPDPLAEQDLAEHFEEFLTLRVPPAAIVQCVSLLRSPAGPRDLSDTAEQPEDSQSPLQPPVVRRRHRDSLSHTGSRSGLTYRLRRGLLFACAPHPRSFVETADTTRGDRQRAGSVGPP